MDHYFLCPNVFVCLVDNHSVFLDLNNDQYLCLELEKTAILKALFGDNEQGISEEAIIQLARELLSRNLITIHPNGRGKPSPPSLVTPTKDLLGYELGKKPKIHLGHMLRFIIAATTSAARLHWQPLNTVIARVKRKKTRFEQRCSGKQISFEQIKELVEIFNRLRPLLFTAHNQCLYDALALNEFLNKYRIYPNVVFGVKIGPFSAHCWVQHNDAVLNDTVALTQLQTPIMVV